MTSPVQQTAPPIRFVGYLACIAGFLLCVTAFYPGYISPDSIRQLTEGRAWSFTDWHPPLMAAVWGLIDRVIPGPFGMLLLQNAVFWTGLAFFWRATYRKSVWLGLCLVTVGFLPTTLALLSTIWKDVGLGVSLLLAAALLHTARRTGSKVVLLASVPMLFYGYGVRHNAAPAILPLTLWSGVIAMQVFRPRRDKPTGMRTMLPVVAGLAYFMLLTAAVVATTGILTGGRSTYIAQAVLLHDLTAISKEKGEAMYPDYITKGEGFSLANATAHYRPDYAPEVFRGEDSPVHLTEDPQELAALRTKWLKVVPANMSIYIRHRWETCKWVTGWGKEELCQPYLATSHSFGGYDVNHWRVHTLLKAVFWKLRNSFFFRGIFWLLTSLALLCAAVAVRLKGDMETVFVLSLSGLLYGAGYFFYTLACDFRFLWWTALAALVGLCFTAWFAVERWRISHPAAK